MGVLAVDGVVLLGGMLMIACGLPFVLVAVSVIVGNLKMRGCALGVIVGSEYGDGDDGWHPIVEFATEDHKVGRFVNSEAWLTREPQVGRSVSVRYDPDDLSVGRIVGFFGSWFGPVLLVLICGTFVVFGAMLATGLA